MSDPDLLSEPQVATTSAQPELVEPKAASPSPETTPPLVAPFSDPLVGSTTAVVMSDPAPDLGMLLFKAPDLSLAPPRARTAPVTVKAIEPVATTAPAELAEHAEPTEELPAEDLAEDDAAARKRRRRGGRGRRPRADEAVEEASIEPEESVAEPDEESHSPEESTASRRRRRRRRSGSAEEGEQLLERPDEVVPLRGSIRLEAKKQRRRDGRESGRRRTVITEAEFLARRESVDRRMIVRDSRGRIQIAVLEDDILVEHYVANETNTSLIGNIYLGRVQNVLPSMEAAFVDIGKGRNAVLYAGEVNWDAAGMEGQPRRIETALKSGDQVLVQVTKDPMGHKGARLTSQISLPGRYLVYVPNGSMTGISRKLPDTERTRLKKILKSVIPEHAGVIVRTAAEGASAEELERDVERLTTLWESISAAGAKTSGASPKLVHGEPDLMVRVIRDVFNEDFAGLQVSGEDAWRTVQPYVTQVAPELTERVTKWTGAQDIFAAHRIDEQLAKAMDRKVFLPSGGSLVIDRTEAMTVVDVNTGKFTGVGGNLEETVTRNNLEAAEEIVRQLRLRDIGGIIVIDFIDMVLESNRDLVLRRLLECLGRDRTKHQVAEVTSLGLVQMTRKRVGQGLLEVFSEDCVHCEGSGVIIHAEPVSRAATAPVAAAPRSPAARPESASTRVPTPAGFVATLSATEDPAAALASPAPQEPAAQPAAAVQDHSGAPSVTAADEPAQLPAPTAAAALASAEPGAAQAGPVATTVATSGATTKPRRRRATAPAGPPMLADSGGSV